ncbi:phage baseplate protein [Cloacibacillus sp. An23]|uniref:phage baseplate protein n=1 Tax=Cloacibacillus sp. An23 TaxID=1965591 RepID=UPI000B37469B|nr:hypothetical protein [Cloacibacillus sp. An23]OUO94808.1 hypothetical protein B5F39_02770 [Cloacibacillus sp. An23]
MPDNTREQWTLMQEGRTLITFTSMLETHVQSDSVVPEEALEQGSFAAYNRTQYSDVFRVRLAIEGDASELQQAQETLKKLKSGTDTFSLVTPDYEHENLTLESYDYMRNQRQGNGLLIVDMRIKEIREVQTGTATLTTTQCKNASNASKQKTGRTQPKEPSDKTKESVDNRTMARALEDALTGGGA